MYVFISISKLCIVISVPLEVNLNKFNRSNIKYLNLFITREVAVLMKQIEPTALLEIPQSFSLKSLRI